MRVFNERKELWIHSIIISEHYRQLDLVYEVQLSYTKYKNLATDFKESDIKLIQEYCDINKVELKFIEGE